MTPRRAFCAFMIIGAGASSPAPLHAHDLWIDLDRWAAHQNAIEVEADFLVGHVADQTAWSLKPQRVVSFVTVSPEGEVADRRDRLVFAHDEERPDAALDLVGEGIHVIAFESNNAGSDLPADKFNDYVGEEGLTAVKRAREEAGATGEPGREAYSRRAKALVKIGEASDLPEALGHTLEIVPLDNPFALKEGAPLRVRVDYKGAPLAGASLSIESLSVGLLPKQRKQTDREGVAAFDFPHSGAWKLNVVWSEPLTASDPQFPEAEFATVFSSLTFGYP